MTLYVIIKRLAAEDRNLVMESLERQVAELKNENNDLKTSQKNSKYNKVNSVLMKQAEMTREYIART